MLLKKTVYDKLVAKVDNIDTSGLVKKIDYNTKISKIKDIIPDTSGLVKKTDYNTKITEIEGKIPNTSGLATKTALTTVENKIPSTTGLVKKKQTTILRLMIFKIYSIMIIVINMLLLQTLIL